MLKSENWRDLRTGDQIRFIAMPTGLSSDNCHAETLEAYSALIARRRPVGVHELDELNMPWIHFRTRRTDGSLEDHYLLINHDGWVRVQSRNSRE